MYHMLDSVSKSPETTAAETIQVLVSSSIACCSLVSRPDSAVASSSLIWLYPPIWLHSARDSASSFLLSAKGSASPRVHRNPTLPWSTSSGNDEQMIATTGKPQSMASAAARPKPTRAVGKVACPRCCTIPAWHRRLAGPCTATQRDQAGGVCTSIRSCKSV